MRTVFLPCEPYPYETVTAIGFFDGVHLAHQMLLKETVRLSKKLGARAGLFTFDNLPCKKGAPLSSLEERLEKMEKCGIEVAFVARFEDVCGLSPETFVNDILLKVCRARAAVCGYNFRFGKNAAGSAKSLVSLLPQSLVLPAVEIEGGFVSSSRIRALLAEGNIEAAHRLLGAPYTVRSAVAHGKSLGHTLGFPTVNMHPSTLLPADGVYETRLYIDGLLYAGVTDVGCRPTVEESGERRMETYIIGYEGDLYGQMLSVSFVRRLRDEISFDSKESLVRRLTEDAALAERNFRNEQLAK